MTKIQSIGIVGMGNVASHMIRFFHAHGMEIQAVIVRNALQLRESNSNSLNLNFSEDYTDLIGSDLVLVCVSDDAITKVVQKIPAELSIAYTSGSIALQTIHRTGKIGVFYPLQTFSKGREVDMTQVPILLESKDEVFSKLLFEFACSYFQRVEFADSEARKKLHLAAVFVNNFVNHLYVQAEKITRENGLDFNLLLPLIQETAQKITQVTPLEAQTGPARRNDANVIAMQRKQLHGPQLALYDLLNTSIQQLYNSSKK